MGHDVRLVLVEVAIAVSGTWKLRFTGMLGAVGAAGGVVRATENIGAWVPASDPIKVDDVIRTVHVAHAAVVEVGVPGK